MMRTNRRHILAGAAGFAGAGLGASCSSAKIIGFDKAARSLDIANSGEPLSLDPHKASGQWENNIVCNMFMGLTTESPGAVPMPGMAESWETSADGLTWTFSLREAYWSDGEACDAHDFEFAFQRILDPATLSEYATLLFPIRNAERVYKGELRPHSLGVIALDDRTLEIQLEHPAPFLPQLLMHYTAAPVPKHRVERYGARWIAPENVAVNGAFTLVKWWSNYIVHLKRNPRFFDAGNVWFEDLYYYPSVDVQASARSTLAGERGWATKFPSNQVDDLRRALPGYVRVAPFLQTTYFSFNTTRAPFNDPRVRNALAMAVDREFIATQIYRTGERPAYALVPPEVADYPATARFPWADKPLGERRAEAEELLRAAGFGPDNPLLFEFSHRNTSDNPRVAVVAQNHWGAIAPWVRCELVPTETQIHYANMRAKNFQVGDGGWIADFNDARNFLYLLETRTKYQNYPGYSNPAYDALVAGADGEADAVKRGEIMNSAEQLALNDAPICTIVFPSSLNLVHPDIEGFEDTPTDIHRARWFKLRGGAL